jgi:hypothetical protein
MTENEAIARALGWTDCERCRDHDFPGWHRGVEYRSDMPDFTRSLDGLIELVWPVLQARGCRDWSLGSDACALVLGRDEDTAWEGFASGPALALCRAFLAALEATA